jgi:dihydrofolate reductase
MKVVAIEHVTVDGVAQAPGRPDEDTRGGFRHGGWSAPYGDEVLGRFMGERMSAAGALLLGRRTYEDFHGFWPQQTDNPYTEVLNNTRKYVASTTLHEPLPWSNSVLLGGDVGEAVAELRSTPGRDLVILGSLQLVQSLLAQGQIDELLLIVNPLVLGSGRHLFAEAAGADDSGAAAPTSLRLVRSTPTTTGAILATYEPSSASP